MTHMAVIDLSVPHFSPRLLGRLRLKARVAPSLAYCLLPIGAPLPEMPGRLLRPCGWLPPSLRGLQGQWPICALPRGEAGLWHCSPSRALRGTGLRLDFSGRHRCPSPASSSSSLLPAGLSQEHFPRKPLTQGPPILDSASRDSGLRQKNDGNNHSTAPHYWISEVLHVITLGIRTKSHGLSPCFADEEAEVQRCSRCLPPFTQLLNWEAHLASLALASPWKALDGFRLWLREPRAAREALLVGAGLRGAPEFLVCDLGGNSQGGSQEA